MVHYHLPCQDRFFNLFLGWCQAGLYCCWHHVNYLRVCFHLLAAPDSSPGTPQEIRWHLLMLTLVSSFVPANVSMAFIRHDVPSPKLLLPHFLLPQIGLWWLTGKLSTMGNVVCRSSLLVSLPALAIHNGTPAVTVTWRCHLVLHTSAQISWQAAVLTNRDFTLSNKSVPQRRPLIGLASWHCCGCLWEEDGTPLKTPSANSCWQFSGLLVTGMLLCYGVAAFSEAKPATFTPSTLSTNHISKGLWRSTAL